MTAQGYVGFAPCPVVIDRGRTWQRSMKQCRVRGADIDDDRKAFSAGLFNKRLPNQPGDHFIEGIKTQPRFLCGDTFQNIFIGSGPIDFRVVS